MKATVDSHEIVKNRDFGTIQFSQQEIPEEIKVVKYLKKDEDGRFIISLYSQLFSGNQLNVFIRNNRIVLFITEFVDSGKFETRYVSDWQNLYPQSYTRMRNVSLLLPGDNFFLLRHFLVPEKYLLKILLGQISDS